METLPPVVSPYQQFYPYPSNQSCTEKLLSSKETLSIEVKTQHFSFGRSKSSGALSVTAIRPVLFSRKTPI